MPDDKPHDPMKNTDPKETIGEEFEDFDIEQAMKTEPASEEIPAAVNPFLENETPEPPPIPAATPQEPAVTGQETLEATQAHPPVLKEAKAPKPPKPPKEPKKGGKCLPIGLGLVVFGFIAAGVVGYLFTEKVKELVGMGEEAMQEMNTGMMPAPADTQLAPDPETAEIAENTQIDTLDAINEEPAPTIAEAPMEIQPQEPKLIPGLLAEEIPILSTTFERVSEEGTERELSIRINGSAYDWDKGSTEQIRMLESIAKDVIMTTVGIPSIWDKTGLALKDATDKTIATYTLTRNGSSISSNLTFTAPGIVAPQATGTIGYNHLPLYLDQTLAAKVFGPDFVAQTPPSGRNQPITITLKMVDPAASHEAKIISIQKNIHDLKAAYIDKWGFVPPVCITYDQKGTGILVADITRNKEDQYASEFISGHPALQPLWEKNQPANPVLPGN